MNSLPPNILRPECRVVGGEAQRSKGSEAVAAMSRSRAISLDAEESHKLSLAGAASLCGCCELPVAPEVSADKEELSSRLQWGFAAGFVGAWGPITTWSTNRITLFVVYYQANVAALSIVGILMSIIDSLNGPLIARCADAGTLNRWHLFPVATWGRRAPWMALGMPLTILDRKSVV